MNLSSLYIVLVALSFFSCQKVEKEKFQERLEIHLQMLQEYGFGEDSYWVFENSNFERDSIYISEVESKEIVETIEDETSELVITTEYYEMHMISSLNNNFINSLSSGVIFEFSPNRESGTWTFIMGNSIGNGFNAVTLVELYDSLEVGGFYFENVRKFDLIAEYQNDIYFENDLSLYYSPGVGLIKKEIFGDNPEIWELQSWEIH